MRRTWREIRSVISQMSKYRGALLGLVCCLIGYALAIKYYLHDLAHPAPLLFALVSSLGMACWNDCSFRNFGLSVRRVTVTAMVFVIGAVLAPILRAEYLEMMSQAVTDPNFMDIVGHDYYEMIRNKVIGYGGSFAVSLLISRLFLQHRVEHLLSRLWGTGESSASFCPHCNQPI